MRSEMRDPLTGLDYDIPVGFGCGILDKTPVRGRPDRIGF